MKAQSPIPSSYYPEYFKVELGIDSENPSPFSEALDRTLLDFLLFRVRQYSALDQRQEERFTVRLFLENLGFCLDALSESQIQRIYRSRLELFQMRGRLGALELLAEIYFGSFELLRGYPFEDIRLSQNDINRIPLSAGRIDSHQFSLRLKEPASPELKASFLKTSAMFVPERFQIFVADPKTLKPSNSKPWRLHANSSISTVRI